MMQPKENPAIAANDGPSKTDEFNEKYHNKVPETRRFFKAALSAIERGLSVIPLGRDKKALLPWKKYQIKPAKKPVIEGWVERWPDANLGIITGKISGLLVIDCDSEAARRRLDEYLSGLAVPEVRTPKGYHLYFKYRPGLKNGVRVLDDIDIRTDGGYVVAPPSVNGDGVSYKWIAKGNGSLLEIPEALFALLVKPEPASGPRSLPGPGTGGPYGQKALEDEARKVADASPGNRNNKLNESALKLGGLVAGGVLDELAVVDALLHATLSCGLPEREARATVESGMKKGMQEPRIPPKSEQFSGHNGGSGREKERTTPPGEDEWESPIPLGSPRPGPMPADLLPGPVGGYAKAVALFTETPPELGAGLALPAVAAAVAGKYEVEVKPGYREPTNIMVAVVLETGNRKTGVVELMTAPIMDWESEQYLTLAPEIKRISAKNKAVESRISKLNSDYAKAKSPEDRVALLDEIAMAGDDLEPLPVAPRVIFQDITPEHAGTMAALHDGRMAIIDDEGGSFFEVLAGRYSRNGSLNVDLFLKGYSGAPVRVDRGSREAVIINRPAFSMGISPQPVTVERMFSIPGFRERGGPARIGFLMPESPLGYRNLEGPPIPAPVAAAYRAFIYGLLNLPIPENGPEILRLSPPARAEWKAFALHIEHGLAPGAEYESIKDWGGKLPGFAARLAGLLHLMAPTGPEISIETMSKALALASIFLEHARFVFGMAGADPALVAAEKIWAWAERERTPEFSKRDCFNALKSAFHSMDRMEPGLKTLEERNYIMIEKRGTGGRPSHVCHINPEFIRRWS